MATSHSKRSPAFQFYPESWFSSSKVSRMTHTERGIYIDLLGRCWLENGLPTDLAKLAAALKLPIKRFTRMWTRGALCECFFERGGKLHNARLERERKKQTEHRKNKQNAADVRWGRNAGALQTPNDGDAGAMPSVSVSVSDPISKKEKESAEPLRDSSPVVCTFPVVGDPEHPIWPLHQSRVDRWQAAYPNLDVVAECRKAAEWAEANVPKRKTAKGMPAFIVNWLNNATNRPAGARSGPVLGSKTGGNVEALQRFVARGRTA